MKPKTIKYKLDTLQCAKVAMFVYAKWQEAMEPPLFIYEDFPTWLNNRIKEAKKPE